MTEKEINNIEIFEKSIIENNVSNEFLVQIFELSARYLNLQTLTNYAKSEKISYNGAKKRKLEKVVVDKEIFIINNN